MALLRRQQQRKVAGLLIDWLGSASLSSNSLTASAWPSCARQQQREEAVLMYPVGLGVLVQQQPDYLSMALLRRQQQRKVAGLLIDLVGSASLSSNSLTTSARPFCAASSSGKVPSFSLTRLARRPCPAIARPPQHGRSSPPAAAGEAVLLIDLVGLGVLVQQQPDHLSMAVLRRLQQREEAVLLIDLVGIGVLVQQ